MTDDTIKSPAVPVLTAEMAAFADGWLDSGDDTQRAAKQALLAIASGAHVVVTAAKVAEWKETINEDGVQLKALLRQHDELLAALEPIRPYFRSANGIPVERATVKASEWAAVEAVIAKVTTP